jgi:hypothetical protein
MKRLFVLIGIISLLLLSVGFGYTGQATLSWVAPTTNEDGTPLTDLAGYKIYYGTTSGTYTKNLDVGNVNTFSMTGLQTGTYYFVATAYNTAKLESGYSNEVSKNITNKPSAPSGCSIK